MFSGDQSFSCDQQVDLMGDEWGCIGPHFGVVEFHPGEIRFLLGYSSVFWPVFPVFLVYTGFFSFLGDLDETWDLQPLVSTSHSGLLIWTKGVLQGVSGGALWVVR